MTTNNLTSKILKGMNSFADNMQWKGEPILRSNNAINKVGRFVLGESDTGIRGTVNAMTQGHKMNFKDAVVAAHTKNGLGKDINWGAVAGTYVGIAAAGRIATGGGLYRDSTGNPNIPVVPFV